MRLIKPISPDLSLFKMVHRNELFPSSKISNLVPLHKPSLMQIFFINITTRFVLKRNSCGRQFAGFNVLRYSGRRPSLMALLSQFSILSTLIYILYVEEFRNPFIISSTSRFLADNIAELANSS